VDVEATPANLSQEVKSTRTMIERVERQRDLKPRRLVGDTAYGTAVLLGWMVGQKHIEPHVSVLDKTTRKDNTFSRSEFLWNEQADEYRCPAGNALRSDWRPLRSPRTHITKADTIVYRSSQMDCDGCSMKDRCCPNISFREITRSVHEDARDEARRIAATPEYQQSRRQRKKVEMLFAHLKRILKLDRLRLRGPSGAHDEFLIEFLMAATAQNLRRMAKWPTPDSKQANQAIA
jgi:Transposase DDE domain